MIDGGPFRNMYLVPENRVSTSTVVTNRSLTFVGLKKRFQVFTCQDTIGSGGGPTKVQGSGDTSCT